MAQWREGCYYVWSTHFLNIMAQPQFWKISWGLLFEWHLWTSTLFFTFFCGLPADKLQEAEKKWAATVWLKTINLALLGGSPSHFKYPSSFLQVDYVRTILPLYGMFLPFSSLSYLFILHTLRTMHDLGLGGCLVSLCQKKKNWKNQKNCFPSYQRILT